MIIGITVLCCAGLRRDRLVGPFAHPESSALWLDSIMEKRAKLILHMVTLLAKFWPVLE